MSRERRLGRGLEALLGRNLEAEAASDAAPSVPASDENISCDAAGQPQLRVDLIDANPYQPRTHFDEAELADLCDSIRTHGILQPIVVRKVGERFELIAGERRLRAAQLAEWETVPAQVREVADREMAELAIVENVQRKDLGPLEKATSFQRYLEEYGATQEELASRVNVDRSTIANLIRLLELPAEVKALVTVGDIAQGHARALLPLGDEHEQVEMAKRIKREGLSVRATEAAVQDAIRSADGDTLSVVGTDGKSRPVQSTSAAQLTALEDQLRLALGAKVDLKQTAKGRGRVTIHFKNNDEFERIKALLIAGSDSLGAAG